MRDQNDAILGGKLVFRISKIDEMSGEDAKTQKKWGFINQREVGEACTVEAIAAVVRANQ